jgi:hypothetical protein
MIRESCSPHRFCETKSTVRNVKYLQRMKVGSRAHLSDKTLLPSQTSFARASDLNGTVNKVGPDFSMKVFTRKNRLLQSPDTSISSCFSFFRSPVPKLNSILHLRTYLTVYVDHGAGGTTTEGARGRNRFELGRRRQASLSHSAHQCTIRVRLTMSLLSPDSNAF